jgi:hypothetical protein
VKNIFPNQQEKETLLTQLNLLGAKHVYVEFSGSGDSGQIDDVYYRDGNDDDHRIPNDMIAWTKQTYGEQPKETTNMKLVDVIEDLCYRALDQTGLDWYNNEGGQGNLHIDFTETPVAISLNVGVNTMTTDDHHFDMNEEDTE